MIEVMVSVGLFGIILLSLGLITRAGYNQYWEASGSLEVQKAALIGTRLLAKDVSLTNARSIEIFKDQNPPPQPPPPAPESPNGGIDSVIFASPLDANRNRFYNSRGNILWQSFVAYYARDNNGSMTLFRQQQAVPLPSENVPIPSIPGPGVTPTTLAALASPRLILSNVSRVEFDKPASDSDVLSIKLTSFFERRGLFSITIENQMLPRN